MFMRNLSMESSVAASSADAVIMPIIDVFDIGKAGVSKADEEVGQYLQKNSQKSTEINHSSPKLSVEDGKKLSKINSQINKMSREEIIVKLREKRLSTSGNKDVLKKRLKDYYKRLKTDRRYQPKKIAENSAHGRPFFNSSYDYIVFIDFECTCIDENPKDFPHEIIEFPAILLNLETLEIVSKFFFHQKFFFFMNSKKILRMLNFINLFDRFFRRYCRTFA